MSDPDYTYSWRPGTDLFTHGGTGVLEAMAQLYSEHYGFWSAAAPKAGRKIHFSADRIRTLLRSEDSNIALAYHGAELIGYAIWVRSLVPHYGVVSWITQFVVHESHRHRGIGKALLFSIWGFSDHFSWGLVTANPYAVRALEKATRRRCQAGRIAKNHRKLLAIGANHVPYIREEMERSINKEESRVNTSFLVDHSELSEMLASVVTDGKPWQLGELPEGWEWFAFTFNDQDQLALTSDEIEAMLKASDDVVKEAYSRMQLQLSGQRWARHTAKEVPFIIEACNVAQSSTILDLGCGLGRHAIAFAEQKMAVTGIDYVPAFIERAKAEAARSGVGAEFLVGDCRTIDLRRKFDVVLCLYDVIGTYADNAQNTGILRNLARHMKSGGKAVISVMNYALTERLAQHRFQLSSNPGRLLDLPPSRTMEETGNIFDPKYLMVDTETQVIYRREQFASGGSLPVELIVRDRRFRGGEIGRLCEDAGLKVSMLRFVRAGQWETPLAEDNDSAKEILLICEK